MSAESSKRRDYDRLSPARQRGSEVPGDLPSLSQPTLKNKPASLSTGLTNLHISKTDGARPATNDFDPPVSGPAETVTDLAHQNSGSEQDPGKKKEKTTLRDRQLLSADRWLFRNGHLLTYIGLYLFSILVLFRPYEIVPGLGFLSATAFYFAIGTLVIYIPSQLATEGNLTMMSTEVKAILAMTLIALITMPIAKDPAMAWSTFNDSFIKAVVIFIVLVNAVRTRKRLMGLMWLSFGIAVYLSFTAVDMYMKGQFNVEEYRVAVDVGGMFGNPNEMALHLVMMTPIVITLGIAAKNGLWRWVYFGAGFLFVAATMVTFSRGGFLGLIAALAVLAWKLGRKYRLNVTIASILIGGAAIIVAPGNYGLRMLSIFIPGLDAVGSSDQRRALLERSLLVTARNPWGIGIGNFQIVGIRNLQSHNAFTQVSSELGIIGLIAYLIFMISPFRKLGAIERTLFDSDDHDWFYYVAIGLQASIVGYLVSSFFASVAYNWFIYYLIAYAVAFRRIYSLEKGSNAETAATPVMPLPIPAQ
jgi:putative inorganic carbon (HCO3(-)) transporter